MARCAKWFVLLLMVFSCSSALAITDEEIFRNFQFSFLNPGARSTAMGGAFIGLADDATAAEANPAGLMILTKPEVSFEYRNTSFDEDKLNALTSFERGAVSASLLSSNELEELNQPSFLSVVFPAGGITFAFSRQEAVSQEGTIEEDLIISVNDEPQLGYAAFGNSDLLLVNWNFSAATKLTDTFSVGASLRYSQLDWQAGVENFVVDLVNLRAQNVFDTVLDDTDNAFAYNLGAIWYPSPKFSIGGVYKRNPKFEVTETEVPVNCPGCQLKPGPFPNVLKVPDVYGIGVAIKPTDNFTITSDIVRIMYSDLTEDIRVGYNVLTFDLTDADVAYRVDDATEFHLGLEGVVFLKNTPVALRQGYYRKPANSLVVERVAGGQIVEDIMEFLFTEREDENHFTFGAGIVLSPHLQVDWAWDIAKSTDSFVISTVARF